jgi:hypothetical protein
MEKAFLEQEVFLEQAGFHMEKAFLEQVVFLEQAGFSVVKVENTTESHFQIVHVLKMPYLLIFKANII